MPKGKPHPAEFKARATIEVMHAKKTANELTFEHDLNPNLVKNWVAKATFEIARVFTASEDERECDEHREEVGERDYLQRRVLVHYGIDLDSKEGSDRPGMVG